MLNAFRHHRNSHHGTASGPVSFMKCSTPFGIIGILTGLKIVFGAALAMCSTPFGIIGILTSVNTVMSSAVKSAQRLSASLEFSQRAPRRPQSRSAAVLNAFRHHWNSHWSIPRTSPSLSSGAQRLSASLEFSPGMTGMELRAYGCSTPFGIIGILTAYIESWMPVITCVLNAFRHHWNSHSMRQGRRECLLLCSTPFGIIGILTQVRAGYVSLETCAQRLSASLEFSHAFTILIRASLIGAQRLSASLEFSLHEMFRVRGVVPCAQRLSASLEFSRRQRRLVSLRLSWCSTPFGIIGILTRQ